MGASRTIALGTAAVLLGLAAHAAHAQAPDDRSAVARISSDLLSRFRSERVEPQQMPAPASRTAAVVLKPPPAVTTEAYIAPPAPAPVYRPKRILKPFGVGTLSGLEIGAQVSRYQYHEKLGNNPFMNLKGDRIGLEASYTHTLDRDWFLRAEGRMSYGELTYSGSGKSKNNEDFLHDIRALAGKDIALTDNAGLSLYAGFGVRNLYNDIRGRTSTGSNGYRRESHYEYVPVGLVNRIKINDAARIATTLEYDYFKDGIQRSVLKDVNPALMTLENEQPSAYFSARGNIMYETPVWSFGPWIEYWHIKDSEVNCIPGFCGMEPRNETTEVGLRIVRKFN